MNSAKKAISVSPAVRVRESSGDAFWDEAVGILIGFKEMLESRKGHIDIITVHQSVEEMRELVRKFKEVL